jgi:hypothetical protein
MRSSRSCRNQASVIDILANTVNIVNDKSVITAYLHAKICYSYGYPRGALQRHAIVSLVIGRVSILDAYITHRLNGARVFLRNTVSTVLTNVNRIGKHVEGILLLICRPLMEPEEDTTDESQDSHGSVIPHKQRVFGERDKSLTKSVRERRHEVPVRGDERSHILGCFGERELETGDGSENLRESDEHVRDGLCPHIDGRNLVVAIVHIFATRTLCVDEVLDDGSSDHGEGSQEESERDAFDGCKLDTSFAESWVQEVVHDGNEDDQGDGVEIRDDVVGDTVALHGPSLRGQVVVHLVVGEPYDWG